MSGKINFVEKYDKYKNDTSACGRLRFAILFNLPNSPYYEPEKYKKLIEELAETEPLGNYHLFMREIIRKNYSDAFKYLKLYKPYLLGYGNKYQINKELQEFCLLYDWNLYCSLQREIRYLERKIEDLYGECELCTETSFRHCTHYELNRHDIVCLNILRAVGNKFECSICYEDKPYAKKCGGTCFDKHGTVCYNCVLNYERNEFNNYRKCTKCNGLWCKDCDTHIKKCPFCRTDL